MSQSARRARRSIPPAAAEPTSGTASLVRSAALYGELAALAANGDGASASVRAAVHALLKERIADGRKRAEAQLFADGGGLACAARLSALQDEVIRAVVDFATAHVFDAANLSAAERMAVIAVGGYGRGTLAPGSDIDLLFLLPYKQTPLGEQVIEYLLYMLWDLGFKVGHATRTVEECVRLSKADMTIRTSILERRLVWGEQTLFAELSQRFQKDVVEGTGREFIAVKLAERDARHAKSGDSRYLVEPNVKEGKGGLRDLHTLFWIAKYFYHAETEAELVAAGVFSRSEAALFNKAADFLWAVRCHMHFLTGKSEERLSFDIQPEIASRLGYNAHPGLRDVERFMKHYFLIAKDVGDLTGIFCAALEDEQAKEVPGLVGFVKSLRNRARKIPGTLDFRVDNNRITVADRDVFARDPVNLLRVFALAASHRLEYHPDALKLIRRSLRLVDKALRENRQANKLFLDVLTDRNDPELHLRRMSEAGLLGRFVPDFGRIVSMMQFNMYHHYTVDEHLLRSVGILSRIERGGLEQELPISTEIVGTMRDRVPIYVALLLHDVAKGRPEDHSVAGARLAAELCPRFGLDERETELVSWLVQDHLVMSMTAQQRDLGDRKTILDFAEKVMTLDRLKLLTVLTVCDIRAVGPGVWNGWKGQLLRTLYFETEPVVTGGFSQTPRAQRLEAAKKALAARLAAWPDEERARYIDLHYPNYFLSVPIEDQVRHAEFVRSAEAAGDAVATMARTDAFAAITEITVLCPDHPRLLSTLTGGCAAAGANIAGAQIFTMADGRALDVLNLNRAFADDADEMRRANRIDLHVRSLLGGRELMPSLIAQRPVGRGPRAFTLAPQVTLDNRLSNQFTVVEVEGLDRPGILSDMTGALADLSLDIRSAHISTYGEKVVDVFYVTDLTGMKVTSPTRMERTVRRLTAVFEEPEGEATSPAVMPSDRAFGISDAR